MPSGSKATKPKKPRDQTWFGIAEWYGRPFTGLTPTERREYALAEIQTEGERIRRSCPFRSTPDETVLCSKDGGVCSIRLYTKSGATGDVSIAAEKTGIRTTCPHRFKQGNIIYSWVGEVLLRHANPIILGEVPFLRVEPHGEGEKTKDVGSIDNILVHPENYSHWCALEIQAVYFSGEKMPLEFQMLSTYDSDPLPFPVKSRRPDYRSSSAKRLMPQLEIKVPTLRR